MREKTPAHPNDTRKARMSFTRTRSGEGARGIGRRRVVATPVTPVIVEIPRGVAVGVAGFPLNSKPINVKWRLLFRLLQYYTLKTR